MNRVKNIFLLIIILGTIFIISGCGAEIDSTITIDENGKGTRVITAFIDEMYFEYIEGGIEALDEVLNSAKPDVLEMKKNVLEYGGVEYVFSYSFDNIDEYNEKTEQITGKPHDAVYINEDSVFGKVCSFTETNPSYDMVKWATDAIDSAGIVEEGSGTDLFQLDKIYITLPEYEDYVYGDVDTVNFNFEETYPVDKISVITKINFEDTLDREIHIHFDYYTEEKISKDKLMEYFGEFCDEIEREENSSEVKYKLLFNEKTSEQLQDYMKRFSSKNKFTLVEDEDSNPLHPIYILNEETSFTELLKGISPIYGIDYFIYYPKEVELLMEDDNYYYDITETNQGDLELGTTFYDNSFSVKGRFEKQFQINSIDISLNVLNTKETKKTIKYIWNKEMVEKIGYDVLDEYYKKINPNVNIIKSGEQVIYEDTISITKKVDENKENLDSFSYFKKTDVSDKNKDVYLLYDENLFNSILGNLEIENDITYNINVPKKWKIKYVYNNGEKKTLEENSNTIELNFEDNNNIIEILLEKPALPIFEIAIGCILIISIVTIIIIYKRKKTRKIASDV
ncbi:hypothetical protein [Defluviitalea phaphyphila]|uniref:hypothetical protein n=1 Tax=Defluviitalea phaphyphila TaxID=1473580 RepID=UPI00072FB919|nr:hypothetical protein [Defluviitalea phaphyphila]